MFRRLLVKIVLSSLALWLADYLLAGFSVSDGLRGVLLAGLVLGLLNALVRPVLKLVTFPLIMVTFGLFSVIINMLMLWLAADLTGLITIDGLTSLSLATLIVSLAHIFEF